MSELSVGVYYCRRVDKFGRDAGSLHGSRHDTGGETLSSRSEEIELAWSYVAHDTRCSGQYFELPKCFVNDCTQLIRFYPGDQTICGIQMTCEQSVDLGSDLRCGRSAGGSRNSEQSVCHSSERRYDYKGACRAIWLLAIIGGPGDERYRGADSDCIGERCTAKLVDGERVIARSCELRAGCCSSHATASV
jgi:hypothetical protein